MVKNFFNGLSASVKANTTSFMIILIGALFLTFLILPHEKGTDKNITSTYVKLAQNYDAKTERYSNLEEALKLQGQIVEEQTTLRTTKLFRVMMVSLILSGFIGVLATLLRYIYTGLPFVKKAFAGEDGIVSDAERNSMMIVNAAALVAATIIVMTVFCVTYIG